MFHAGKYTDKVRIFKLRRVWEAAVCRDRTSLFSLCLLLWHAKEGGMYRTSYLLEKTYTPSRGADANKREMYEKEVRDRETIQKICYERRVKYMDIRK